MNDISTKAWDHVSTLYQAAGQEKTRYHNVVLDLRRWHLFCHQRRQLKELLES